MLDSEVIDIITKLKNCGHTSYYIAKKTGLSNSSIANWINGKTRPNPANIAILERFFDIECKGSQNINAGIINHSTVTQDNRQYYSDSPDVLRSEIDKLDRIIAEKEERIKEKDSQIKEKDSQIKALLEILSNK